MAAYMPTAAPHKVKWIRSVLRFPLPVKVRIVRLHLLDVLVRIVRLHLLGALVDIANPHLLDALDQNAYLTPLLAQVRTAILLLLRSRKFPLHLPFHARTGFYSTPSAQAISKSSALITSKVAATSPSISPSLTQRTLARVALPMATGLSSKAVVTATLNCISQTAKARPRRV